MVRLSFVVGGGKLVRQKYSDELPKEFASALAAVGLKEDNGACCELACAGSYKYQHDTGKNLKIVHVFPRVSPPAADEDAEGGEDAEEEPASQKPADILAECELSDFKQLVKERVTSYGQKKRLLDELKSRLSQLEAAEKKLINRETLDESEQALYDTCSPDGLREKVKLLVPELQACIDNGQLTAEDRASVTEQLTSKLASLELEMKKAESDGKAKLQQKLEEQKSKLKETLAAASDASPIEAPPLRYAAQIQKLHRKRMELERLEKTSAGHYTIDELKRLSEKPEIEEAIEELKERSQLWFESDEEFDRRLQKCLREAAKAAPKKAASGGSGGYNSGWSTVGSKKR